IFAEVIARPLNNWWGVLTINKGRRHGVEPHMGVVAAHGAVGHIRSVSAFSSEVILLSDPRSAVGAIVQRTGEPVLVEGLGYPGTRLRLRPLTAEADIVEGDVIVTSGMSSIFPKGVPVGVVEEVAVGPYVDFGTLEVVAVLGAPGDGRAASAAPGAADGDGP